jgi:hypothetical protein
MHKKLEAELMSLAHQILQMKNKDDAASLRDKAKEVYEKLSVLTFIDDYFLTTPNAKENKEALISKIENATLKEEKNTIVEKISEPEVKKELKKVAEPIKKQPKEIVEKATKVQIKESSKKQEKNITVESKQKKVAKKADDIKVKEDSKKLEKQTTETIKLEATKIIKKIHEQKATSIRKKLTEHELKRKTLEEELKDSIPADVAANMFEKVKKQDIPKEMNILDKKITSDKRHTKKPEVNITQNQNIPKEMNILDKKITSKEKPVAKPKVNIVAKQKIKAKVNIATKQHIKPKVKPKQETKTSLNDKLFQQRLQVGLNDRIAFVKHLFNFSQEEFNTVLAQINTLKTEAEAKNYLINTVKPKYDWSDKDEYVERLNVLIERKYA